MAFHDAFDAEALAVAEGAHRRKGALAKCGVGDRPGDRMVGGVLDGPEDPELVVSALGRSAE